jgi:hypothetical protein
MIVTDLSAIQFITVLGAIWSFTRLLVTDSIFDRPRDWVMIRYPYPGLVVRKISDVPEGRRSLYRSTNVGTFVSPKGTFLGKLLSCPWCLSFYVAIAAVLLLEFAQWADLESLYFSLAFLFLARGVTGAIESTLH